MYENRNPRRIVSAMGADGKSYTVVDELPPRVLDPNADLEALRTAYPNYAEGSFPDTRAICGFQELPIPVPLDPVTLVAQAVPRPGPLAAQGGLRVSLVTYPPGWDGEMTWHNTVDLLFIIAGELTYVTDDGNEIVAQAGDVIVQGGTMKAHVNRGQTPVTVGVVMCGAVRAGETPPLDRYHGSKDERDAVLAYRGVAS